MTCGLADADAVLGAGKLGFLIAVRWGRGSADAEPPLPSLHARQRAHVSRSSLLSELHESANGVFARTTKIALHHHIAKYPVCDGSVGHDIRRLCRSTGHYIFGGNGRETLVDAIRVVRRAGDANADAK